MRSFVQQAVVYGLLLTALGLVLASPTLAKIVPDDVVNCVFADGQVSYSGHWFQADATCRLDEKDGSPEDGTYPAVFNAWGNFTPEDWGPWGNDLTEYCPYGSLDGDFQLDIFSSVGGSVAESHWGSVHLQFGYGVDQQWEWPFWIWLNAGPLPGHFEMSSVNDWDGHWGGSGEGVIQLKMWCLAADGAFAVHL